MFSILSLVTDDPMKGTLVTLCFHLTNVLLTVGTNLLDFRSTLFLFTGTAEGLRQEGEGGQNSNRFSFIVFIPSTLLTLLRIPFLGRIGSISYVLPIRQNIDILNRDSRVGIFCTN